MESPLRFHWSPHPQQVPANATGWIQLCEEADGAGFESIEVPEHALPFVTASASRTAIRFRFPLRSQGTPPAVSPLLRNAIDHLGRRVIVHWNADTAADPDLQSAANSFSQCRSSEAKLQGPEIHVEGDSADAAFLAIQQADCLWRHPDRPNQVYADALPVLHFGKEVGIVTSLIARPTNEEAFAAARSLFPADSPLSWDDPSLWLTPHLWTGASPTHGLARVAMVGSFRDVAMAIYEFKKQGIWQFLLRGGPCPHELDRLVSGVLPQVHALESGRSLD